MRIRLGFSFAGALMAAVIVALGAVAGSTPAAAQGTEFPTPPGESSVIRQMYPPTWVSKSDIALFQDALYENECYGNQLTYWEEVDESFGPISKRAMHVFVEAYRNSRPFPGKITLRSWDDVRTEADRSKGRCAGSRSLVIYFPKPEDHDPNAPRVTPWRERWQNLYPNVQNTTETALLRDALHENLCYGNRIRRQGAIRGDQGFGLQAKKALHVYVEAYYAQYGTGKQFANAREVLDAANNSRRLCVNSRFRAEYFSDKKEHDPGTTIGTVPPPTTPLQKSCNADDVITSYLAGRKDHPDAANLRQPLEYFTRAKNFKAIFPEGEVDYTKDMTDKSIERLKRGQANVTYEATKKALDDALYNFKRLSFAYGIKYNPGCDRCYQINDWRYLRNIAQANRGLIIAKYSKSTAYRTFPVDSITEKMQRKIDPNVKIYRSIAAKLADWHAMDPPKTAEEISVLADWREWELDIIIGVLEGKKKSKDKDDAIDAVTNPYMKELEKEYTCIGFDGTAVDQ